MYRYLSLMTLAAILALAGTSCEEQWEREVAPQQDEGVSEDLGESAERLGESAEEFSADQRDQFVAMAQQDLQTLEDRAADIDQYLDRANEQQRNQLTEIRARMQTLIDQTDQAVDRVNEADASEWVDMRGQIVSNFEELDSLYSDAQAIIDEIERGDTGGGA